MDMSGVNAFIDQLAETRMTSAFNPWRSKNEDDAVADGASARRDRLRAHLSVKDPLWMMVGEAPGYQGCRISGIPFTSERLLIEGAIPRIEPTGRLSTRNRPWSEPSATIIWSSFYKAGIAERVILWNAFPFHPYKPGVLLSNRTPTPKELQAGAEWLKRLSDLWHGIRIVAIGQKSEASLKHLGLEPECALRHPAMGGATKFRDGLHTLLGAQES